MKYVSKSLLISFIFMFYGCFVAEYLLFLMLDIFISKLFLYIELCDEIFFLLL